MVEIFSKADWYSIVYVYLPYFLYSFIFQMTFRLLAYLDYSESWYSVHAVYMVVQIYEILISILLDKYPEVGLLGLMVILFLFSIVAISFYIPSNDSQDFWFLHILNNIYCFLFFLTVTILMGCKVSRAVFQLVSIYNWFIQTF